MRLVMDINTPELEPAESTDAVIIQETATQSDELNSSQCEVPTALEGQSTAELQVKRKRGRPPKKRTEHVQEEPLPTRVSKRTRKQPKLINYEADQMKCLWTNKDKIQFLKGLEEVGPENLKALNSFLPHKTENDIQNQIRMWSNFARIELQKKVLNEKEKIESGTMNAVAKLDEWIHHFEELEDVRPPRLFALSNIFLLIAEYGKFPHPNEFNGIDLRAMYRYIHCMMNGQPYYGINQSTAKVLNNCIAKMLQEMRSNRYYLDKLQDQLYSSNQGRSANMKTYSTGRRRLTANSNPETLMTLPDLNPLNIKQNLLLKPDFFTCSDSSSDSD